MRCSHNTSLSHRSTAPRDGGCRCRVLPASRFLPHGERAGTCLCPSGTAWAILVHDRRDDQPVGQEPYSIKERLMLRRASGQAQGHAIEGIDKEGNREEQEKTVAGVAPKAQEKES